MEGGRQEGMSDVRGEEKKENKIREEERRTRKEYEEGKGQGEREKRRI